MPRATDSAERWRTAEGDRLDTRAAGTTVQRLAGHAGVCRTARDDRCGGAAGRAATDLRLPYGRRRH